MARILPIRPMYRGADMYRRAGMGDLWSDIFGAAAPGVLDAASAVAQYGPPAIQDAYVWLYQWFQSEQQFLQAANQWMRDNGAGLSAQDQQSYLAVLNDQTDAVNTLSNWVIQAQDNMQRIGIAPSVGLSGYRNQRRGMGSLGIAPAVAIIVVAAIIGVVVVTVSIMQNRTAASRDAVATLQANITKQASDQCLALVASGKMTPQQCQAYMAALGKDLANQNPQPSSIPWGWIIGVGGAVLVAKYVFS